MEDLIKIRFKGYIFHFRVIIILQRTFSKKTLSKSKKLINGIIKKKKKVEKGEALWVGIKNVSPFPFCITPPRLHNYVDYSLELL